MIINNCQLFHKFAPSQGKLLAIDVGTKRLGLSTCDALRFLATPRQIIDRKSNVKDFLQIQKIILEENIVAIVIGLPVNMDGTSNDMTHFSQKFAQEFDNFLENKMPIFFADERLTSFEAKEISQSLKSRKNQKHFDDIAASVILHDFIDNFVKNS